MTKFEKKGKAANWLKAIAALIAYLAGLLTLLFNYIEKRLSYFR